MFFDLHVLKEVAFCDFPSSSDEDIQLNTCSKDFLSLMGYFAVMTMEDSRTQRPYRYGMILLCLGALINWLGISEPTQNAEPIRYLGVACILGKKFYIKTDSIR